MAVDNSVEEGRAIERFKLKRMVKKLNTAKGAGTSMISILIPPKDQISRVSSLLNSEASTASNIKSRVNRQSVVGAIQSAQNVLKYYNSVPKNGLIIYTGTIVDDDGKEKKVTLDFEPYSPINSSLYLCDNKFHTDQLQELIEDDIKYGFIIMDGSGCLIGVLCGQNKQVLFKNSVELPKKHGRGGQSAPRFERIRQEARQNFITKTCDHAKQHFIDGDRFLVKGVVIAGAAEIKTKLSESQVLDYRIRDNIIAIVDVGYGHEQGFNEAIEKTQDIIKNVKHVEEDKALQEFFGMIDKDTGKFCFGPDQVMAMYRNRGIDKLYIYENLQTRMVTMMDPEDESEHIFYIEPNVSYSQDKFRSKISNQPLKKIDDVLLLDYLLEEYEDVGIDLKIISDKTQRGTQLIRGFNGIAAALHFKFDFHFLPDYEDEPMEIANDDMGYSDDTDDVDAL